MCPECGKAMIVLELDGVEIDYCPACGGTWLDAGELEQIAALAGARAERLGEALRRAADEGRSPRRRCPRCRARLRLIEVGQTPPVTLDRCPRGHGLWLDPGELETLVREYAEGDQGAAARFLGGLFKSERLNH